MSRFLAIVIAFILMGCAETGPSKIELNKDACDHCKMNISDIRFATQFVTPKGRYYKFDDLLCLLEYTKLNNMETKSIWVSSYVSKNEFIDVQDAYFFSSDQLRSPMRGNMAAVRIVDSSSVPFDKKDINSYSWKELNP